MIIVSPGDHSEVIKDHLSHVVILPKVAPTGSLSCSYRGDYYWQWVDLKVCRSFDGRIKKFVVLLMVGLKSL